MNVAFWDRLAKTKIRCSVIHTCCVLLYSYSVNRGPYMGAHVLLNLLNELGEKR